VDAGHERREAPDIVGVATLMKYGDVARTETQQAIAYNLLPEHKAYIWQAGAGAGGLESGVGLIAIPSLLKDLDGSGVTSETAIMNLVAKPGFTDFAIYIYDQNGLLDFVCQKLFDRQVEYIDLQTWGYVNNGFKGSAVISATFWEHDVFDPDGKFVRNLVGLGAVMVERTGTRLGEDIPGDEAAGDRGIPFAIIEDFQFGGANNTRLLVSDTVAPYEALSDIVVGGVPANCKITDVNARVNETDTFGHSNLVELTKGTTNTLYDGTGFGFCAPFNVDAILDDDAAVRLADNPDCTEPYGLGQNFKTDAGGLDAFDDGLAAGTWTLRVSNVFGGFGFGDGSLNSWSLAGTCQTITVRKIFTP
jgi:hypothetical protein